MNNCKCGAEIKRESVSCSGCYQEKNMRRINKRPYRPSLTEDQQRFQEFLSYAAPEYYGDVRLEEVIQ